MTNGFQIYTYDSMYQISCINTLQFVSEQFSIRC